MSKPYAVTALPERDFQRSLRRSLATMADAVAFVDALLDRLGERAWLDPWCKPTDRMVVLRDAERPEWLIAQPYVMLDIGYEQPEPAITVEDLPPHMRFEPPKRIEPQTPSPDPRPGVLTIQQGRRIYQVTINRKGHAFEWMRSAGDGWNDGFHSDDRGFAFDPGLLVHDQPLPVDVLCRADLDPDGQPAREVARMVAEADNGRDVTIRVRMPVPVPGGVAGCAARVRARVQELSYAGDLDDPGDGWLCIDAYDGSTVATGDSLDSAYAAWREVAAPQPPKPPYEPPASEELQEAVREALRRRADEDAPNKAGTGSVEKTGKGIAMKAEMRMIFIPPRELRWPDIGVEHTPCVAFRLPPRPPIPSALSVMGFVRTVRVIGQYGEVTHAFVRNDPRGHTVIGEDAARHVDPQAFDAELRAADAAFAKSMEGFGDRPVFARHPDHRYLHVAYTVLAPDKRSIVPPRAISVGHGDRGMSPAHFDADIRWVIARAEKTA